MTTMRQLRCRLVVMVAVSVVGFGAWAGAQTETPAQAGEQIGIEGTYVRIAANQEGWVVLGYRVANESLGEEWMVLDVGMTVMGGVEAQKITRDQIKLVTPDLKVIPLPTQEQFEEARGHLAALVHRAVVMGDSINYFPSSADSPCSLEFFTDPGARRGPRLARDEVELSSNRGCMGRVYFHIPGGIQLGTYNFDVVFANSIIKVPMEIMTDERAEEFTKEWKKALKEAKHKN